MKSKAKFRLGLTLILAVLMVVMATGCGNTTGSTVSTKPVNETTPVAVITTTENATQSGQETPTNEIETTEIVTTEEPTEAPTEPPTTEEPTEPYIGPWTLLIQEPLNPRASGYEELDNLINAKLAELITDDMNNYHKVWACYEYLIDNIQYSRGMDAHTGEYSASDPATTPTEVLWATDLLNTGSGCCYNYSAAFTFMLRALGYNAQIVTGEVPAYAGGTTPHCWVLASLNGAQYTFDPDLDMNYYTREKAKGAADEDNPKDRFFCAPISEYSFFYIPQVYHEI